MRLSQLQRRYTIVLCHNGYPAEDIIKFERLDDVDEWLISNFTPERRYRVRVDSPNEPILPHGQTDNYRRSRLPTATRALAEAAY